MSILRNECTKINGWWLAAWAAGESPPTFKEKLLPAESQGTCGTLKTIKDNLVYYFYWNLKDKGHRKPGGEAGSQEAEANEHIGKMRRRRSLLNGIHLK